MLDNCITTLMWMKDTLLASLRSTELSPQYRTAVLKTAMLSTLFLSNSKDKLPLPIQQHMAQDLALSRNAIAHQDVLGLFESSHKEMICYLEHITEKYLSLFNELSTKGRLDATLETYGKVNPPKRFAPEEMAFYVANALQTILDMPQTDPNPTNCETRASFLFDLITLGELIPELLKANYISHTEYRELSAKLKGLRDKLAHKPLFKTSEALFTDLFNTYRGVVTDTKMRDAMVRLKGTLMGSSVMSTDEDDHLQAETEAGHVLKKEAQVKRLLASWKEAYDYAATVAQTIEPYAAANRIFEYLASKSLPDFMLCVTHDRLLNTLAKSDQLINKTRAHLKKLTQMSAMMDVLMALMKQVVADTVDLSLMHLNTPSNCRLGAYMIVLSSDGNFHKHILPYLCEVDQNALMAELFNELLEYVPYAFIDKNLVSKRIDLILRNTTFSPQHAEALFVTIVLHAYPAFLMHTLLTTQCIDKNKSGPAPDGSELEMPYTFMMAYYAQLVGDLSLFELFIADNCNVNLSLRYHKKNVGNEESTLLYKLCQGHLRLGSVENETLLITRSAGKVYFHPDMVKILLKHPEIDVNKSHPKNPLYCLIDKVILNLKKSTEKSHYPFLKFKLLLKHPQLNLNPVRSEIMRGGNYGIIEIFANASLEVLCHFPPELCVDYFNAAKLRGAQAYHEFLLSVIETKILKSQAEMLAYGWTLSKNNGRDVPKRNLPTLSLETLDGKLGFLLIQVYNMIYNRPNAESFEEKNDRWDATQQIIETISNELRQLELITTKLSTLDGLQKKLVDAMPDSPAIIARLQSIETNRETLRREYNAVTEAFTYDQFGIFTVEDQNDLATQISVAFGFM